MSPDGGHLGRYRSVVIQLRAATRDDAPSIAAINVRSWQVSFRGYFPDRFLDALNPAARESFVTEVVTSGPPHHVTVATEDDLVVGYVMLGPPFDDDVDANETLELYSLYIEPGRIGTGLGRLLMDEALRYLRQGPWKAAVLWAPKRVERTCRFYETAGWVADAEKTEEVPAGNPVLQVRYRIELSDT
jgi:ribosomal protein S18 acetylase RimI-like enzyme